MVAAVTPSNLQSFASLAPLTITFLCNNMQNKGLFLFCCYRARTARRSILYWADPSIYTYIHKQDLDSSTDWMTAGVSRLKTNRKINIYIFYDEIIWNAARAACPDRGRARRGARRSCVYVCVHELEPLTRDRTIFVCTALSACHGIFDDKSTAMRNMRAEHRRHPHIHHRMCRVRTTGDLRRILYICLSHGRRYLAS